MHPPPPMSATTAKALKLLAAGAAALFGAGAGVATAKHDLAKKADKTDVDSLARTMREVRDDQRVMMCRLWPQDLRCDPGTSSWRPAPPAPRQP